MQYKKISIGRSANNQELFGYINQLQADQYTYLIAGAHGDEPEGVFVLDKLFNWLITQHIITPIIVIPCLNPDGFAAKTRVNANKVDLNRNWPTSDWTGTHTRERYFPGVAPLSEPENVALFKLFEQYKPKIIITFHSWEPMLDHNDKAQIAAQQLAKYNGYKLVTNIGYPTPGSLGTYAQEVLECGIITYELPIESKQNRLKEIWLNNEKGLKSFFGGF